VSLFAIYFGFVIVAILVGVAAVITVRDPQRSCPRCGNRVSIHARVCRMCRYRMSGRHAV